MKKFFCGVVLALLAVLLAAGDKPKALLIMMDGARNDAFLTSGFSPLADGEKILGAPYQTAVALYTETVPGAPTMSAPNHTGLATGVIPWRNGVYNNGDTAYGRFDKYPHILSLLAGKYKTAFLYGWGESGQIKASDPRVEYLQVNERKVEQAAVERIRNGVDAMYVYIDEPDEAGHGHGFYPNSPEYRRALEADRNIIRNLLTAIKNRPDFASEDWLIIAVSDHGGYHRGHGMMSNHALVPILSVLGKKYRKGFLTENLCLVDAPATILNHFGVNPSYLDGKVIPNKVVPFSGKLPADLTFVKYQRDGNQLPFTFDLNMSKGFSIYLQVNAAAAQKGDVVLLSNKNWDSGANPGLVLAANYSRDGSGPGYFLNIGLKGGPRYRLDLGALDPAPGKEVGLLISVFPNDKCYLMECRSPDECYLLSGKIPRSNLETGMKFQVGTDGKGNYGGFQGAISDVRVLERPLYPDEMLAFCRKYYRAK